MADTARAYIPAAGHHWSLPLYDPFTRLIGVDRLREELLDQADLTHGQRVLDIGCGTGTLAVLLKRRHPDVDVTGVDPDPGALDRGLRKAARAGVSIRFDRGYADALPYADASFDRVLSSFMFHHLQGRDKHGMLAEARRVLKPGGRLELADFAGPGAGGRNVIARMLHSHRLLEDNAEARVIALMGDAGFIDARRVRYRPFLLGQVAYYEALKKG